MPHAAQSRFDRTSTGKGRELNSLEEERFERSAIAGLSICGFESWTGCRSAARATVSRTRCDDSSHQNGSRHREPAYYRKGSSHRSSLLFFFSFAFLPSCQLFRLTEAKESWYVI